MNERFERPTRTATTAAGRGLLDPLREFLARPAKRFRGRVAELSFEAAGGVGPVGAELGAAVELIHSGSLAIDDIQDGSAERRGAPALHVLHGVPLAINAGGWLYFAGLERIAFATMPDATAGLVLARAISMLRRCHEGQALDMESRAHELPASAVPVLVAEITRMKTASLFELAAEVGARVAHAQPPVVAALVGLASAIGTALQILDDVSGVASPRRRAKGLEDARLGRATWPWALMAAGDPVLFDQAAALAAANRHEELLALLARQETSGRARATLLVGDALVAARTALGRAPALDQLADEVDRLLRSFD